MEHMRLSSISPRKRNLGCLEMFPVSDSTPTSAVLESPNYSGHILQGLNKLRSSDMLCDYTLMAGGCSLRVHRAVMVISRSSMIYLD